MTPSPRTQTIIAVAVVLPFCLVGVITAMLAISAGLSGEWNKGLFIGAFALAFGGIGFGSVRKMPLTDVVGIGTLIGMESRKTLYYRTL